MIGAGVVLIGGGTLLVLLYCGRLRRCGLFDDGGGPTPSVPLLFDFVGTLFIIAICSIFTYYLCSPFYYITHTQDDDENVHRSQYFNSQASPLTPPKRPIDPPTRIIVALYFKCYSSNITSCQSMSVYIGICSLKCTSDVPTTIFGRT